MDELIHHCLRELSFDGDLGSKVSRLKDFIVDFYAQAGGMNVDDSFSAFVWSLIVQQPTVRVGIIPEGLTSEVWIAPQASAKKKAKARGEEREEREPPRLDIVVDAMSRSLESLVEEFGDKLRIAIEPDAIYAAITGSHIRVAKLSPMVYTALQIITRGRDNGVSVVSLGQQSGYDQKTCFYLIKQLIQLDLVVKVRRGGVGTNFCIHKYFFERNPHWKAIREEEHDAEEADKMATQPLEEFVEEEALDEKSSLGFTPIDARHLSSLPLVRSRIVKLLKSSKSHIHESNNVLVTIGFSNPTKTDRRFFQSRIRELIQQGVIEKVLVPSTKKKSGSGMVKCFRLVTAGSRSGVGETVPVGDDDDDDGDERDNAMAGVKTNVTVHRQAVELIEESGTRGMTLSEISASLSHFDKRTIELLLARAEKFPPPAHLADLGIAALMETSGRERRYRYYTVAAYRKLIAQEQFDQSSAEYGADFSGVGEFLDLKPKLFFEDEKGLHEFEDKYKTVGTPTRKNKQAITKAEIPSEALKRLVGPRKSSAKDKGVNDLDQRMGGPTAASPDVTEPPRKKRRIDHDGDLQNEPTVPKRRGRPPKVKDSGTVPPAPAETVQEVVPDILASPLVRKKRGRPPKDKLNGDVAEKSLRNRKKRKLVHATEDAVLTSDANKERDLVPIVNDETVQQTASGEVDQGSSEFTLVDTSNDNRPEGDTLQGISGHEVLGFHASPLPVNDAQPLDTVIGETTTNHLPSQQDDLIPIDPVLMSQEAISHNAITSEQGVAPSPNIEKKINPDNRISASARNRANVSHMRRENEFYRVVENLGGISNAQSKEFYKAHSALLEDLTKAGEPTSGPPGITVDKRTAQAAFDALETRGRVKQLKTSVQTHTGVRKPIRIIYLPDVTEDRLKAYLVDLARNSQPVSQTDAFVKIDEKVEYGADSTSVSRSALPLQLLQMEEPGTDKQERWSKNVARANQLFNHSDETIREVLLAERTTLAQLYGFIVGKMARIRELHIFTLRALEADNPSNNIVSKEPRIVDISFFCHDLPLAVYTSFISCLNHSEALTAFYSTEEGRQTFIRDMPPDLHSLLQIGRSRARSRFLEMLEVLRLLGVVTPLQPTESENPSVTCVSKNDHPNKFNEASLEGWTSSTPMVAPSYWKFNAVAPIYWWHKSETDPPFWKDMPLDNVHNAARFWETLCNASTGALEDSDENITIVRRPIEGSLSLARSLRRSGSWNSQYVLTWHQMQYLKQFINIHSGQTPLEEPDEAMRTSILDKVCSVTSAPKQVVIAFYRETHDRLVQELNKTRREEKVSHTGKGNKQTAKIKESLAKKAAEARRKREQEWDSLLLRVHPEPLGSAAAAKVKRVQKRFLEAGFIRDIQKWETDLLKVIHEAGIARAMVKTTNRLTVPQSSFASSNALVLPPTVLNLTEPSVRCLIQKQGTPIQPAEPPKKRKRRKKTDDKEGMTQESTRAPRRARFQWNRDYDELARDAAAIIRARCRNTPRIDWSAFERVFPSVPRNSVRQRLAHVRETPGHEAYMNRLEEKWYELWIQHRGTTLLPDDNPQSTSNFDLIKHIEFLRNHVDKNSLRVGFGHGKEGNVAILPSSLEKLLADFEVEGTESCSLTWDCMWNTVVEEERENRLTQQAFTRSVEEIPLSSETQPDAIALAESALKMTLGTPNERYSASQGSMILQSIGQENVGVAAKEMISQGLLSKLVHDTSKDKPGRQWKISENNLNTIGGSIPKETVQDAFTLEELILQSDTWREWPLTATDGDSMALIELLSQHSAQLEFKIDTSHPQTARSALDWNSKKADDDDIETAIFYRNLGSMEQVQPDADVDESEDVQTLDTHPVSESTDHGFTEDREIASCKKTANHSIIDCIACLREELLALTKQCSSEEEELVQKIYATVKESGRDGITMTLLQSAINRPKALLMDGAQKLTETPVPLVYWTGYTRPVLVPAALIRYWSVKISEDPLRRVFPRRWLDTEGNTVAGYWKAALRAVLGLVIFKPGISQTEIRWRLRATYDRPEIYDIINYLVSEGFLTARMDAECTGIPIRLLLDDRDGRHIFYFISGRRWYQV